MFFNFTKKSSRGFSILEAVIAIYVITMGLLGIMSLVLQGVRIQYINKNSIIASELAQEGLELVRNQRDINWLNNSDWKTGSTPPQSNIVQDGSYSIDYKNGITNIADINDLGAWLYFDSNGFYSHDTTPPSTASIFKRLIEVTDNTSYLKVKCTIQWNERGKNKIFVAQSFLYNWR
jgi:Tfp pilus assembly protein PilV